ncbi:MAG: helicase-related protein [Vulcanimicrobiaceae bacterium]
MSIEDVGADTQSSYEPELFQVTLSAPQRSSLAIIFEDDVEHPLFGTTKRRRLICLAHLYDQRTSLAVDVGEIGHASNLAVEKVADPFEYVLMEGPRPDPRFCMQRLRALWLYTENRSGQLNNDPVLPFRHQAALLQFLTAASAPSRVLVADEVGLGKTVEAGLLIREMLRAAPQSRILYVTPGGLVANVLEEFQRLDLPRWHFYGNLNDEVWQELNAIPVGVLTEEVARVVASMHKLCDSARWDEQHRMLGDTRFDLIIVDECHMLRAYGERAQKQQVWFGSVRQILQDHLAADGKVLFLSATPHQGNREVFLNLVALCVGSPLNQSGDEKAQAARGRVVFRVKEHIRDWDNGRVFPSREVREPKLADPPANYRSVLERIAEHFDWIAENAGGAQGRAVGFVKSQALQYAASSLRAGFAYLLRRLIRYHPEVTSLPELQHWAARLLPYRKRITSAEDLLHDWTREFRTSSAEYEGEVPEEELSEDTGPGVGTEEAPRLLDLLRMYDRLFDDREAGAKFRVLFDIIDKFNEPIVVFSQAVDTVYELEMRLRQHGCEVYRITGDMAPEDRGPVIRDFRTSSNQRRLLLSSAAGGVGINLQVARVVVHFDLPWNPMVLEQRVGRVHRIGSVKTIIVETILLRGSREAEVYDRITHRLHDIVRDLSSDPAEREALFRRILASLDQEALREILSGEQDLDAIGATVEAGRRAVDEADAYMRNLAAQTTENRGRASMGHLIAFLQAADPDFRKVGTEVYAVIVDLDGQELTQRRCEAGAYVFDRDGESLVFDRTAASYLNMRRQRTGGIGHHSIDPLLRAAIGLGDEPKSRCSTWISLSEGAVEDVRPGDLLYFGLEAALGGVELTNSRLRGWRVRGNDWRELSESDIESFLWDVDIAVSRKAGDVPLLESLLDELASHADISSVHFPIAAIGIRERHERGTAV